MRKRRFVRPFGIAAVACLAAGFALLYLPYLGIARGFAFESYTLSSNAEAEHKVSERLNRLFAAGTPLRDVAEYLGDAGAACRDLPKQPDFLYCTYNHRDAGLRGAFILVEWKLLLWRDRRNTIARIEVHRALTGP